MKYSVLAALISYSKAAKLNSAPDVYGPNGLGYSNVSPDQSMADIGIDILTQGTGDKCSPGDWTSIHWVGSLKDGRVVTDSRGEGDGQPKLFSLGKAEVFKCWDLAVPQLHKGDKAHVSCPAHYVWGDAYTQAPLGGEPIPLQSDIDFEIEVVDCNRVPEFTKQSPQPVTTTMQPGKCMYLHLIESEDTAIDLVLSTEDEAYSKWWPAKYALLEHKVVDDPAQQWYYDEADGSIHNAANPTWSLENDLGWVMVADTGSASKTLADGFPHKRRSWYYNPVTSGLTTDVNGITTELAIWGQPKPWAEVELQPVELTEGTGNDTGRNFEGVNMAKFRIEYCWSGGTM